MLYTFAVPTREEGIAEPSARAARYAESVLHSLQTFGVRMPACVFCGVATGNFCDGCRGPICTECEADVDKGDLECPLCATARRPAPPPAVDLAFS